MKVVRHLQNAQPMSTDDVGKFVDELCNYAKLISLEGMNSHNKQRHNNSSQPHQAQQWTHSCDVLNNNDVYRQHGRNLLKAHIHGAQTRLIGYIQTIEVPTLHNIGTLIQYKTF
jgi:hypothetical protein